MGMNKQEAEVASPLLTPGRPEAPRAEHPLARSTQHHGHTLKGGTDEALHGFQDQISANFTKI